MQATSYGNDPDAMDGFAGQLSTSADRLEQILQQITTALLNTGWRGTSADRFRHDWHNRYTTMLRHAAGELREGATTVRRNAAQQRTASSADDAGAAWAAITGQTVRVYGDARDTIKIVDAGKTVGDKVKDGVDHWGGIRKGIGATAKTLWHDGGDLVKKHDLGAVKDTLTDLQRTAGKVDKFIVGGSPTLSYFTHELRDIKGVAGDAKKFIKDVPVLSKLSIGFDVVDLAGGVVKGVATGDWHDAGSAALHTVIDGVGIAVPEIGLAEAAWDLGKLAYDHRAGIADFAHAAAGNLTPDPTLPAGGVW